MKKAPEKPRPRWVAQVRIALTRKQTRRRQRHEWRPAWFPGSIVFEETRANQYLGQNPSLEANFLQLDQRRKKRA
jgi:hypothetical protein